MSLNWNEIRKPFKNQIDALNISNKNVFKNRINKTLNTSTMKKIVNEAKTLKNKNKRITIADANRNAVNLGRQNGLSMDTTRQIVNLAEKAARDTKNMLQEGLVSEAMISAVVLLTGIMGMGMSPVQIDANRVLNVFPRGLPFMKPWLSATYTPERWAKRAVFWFAQFKTKQFSPMYTLYEEAFATYGKNKKSKVGQYMTSLFVYSYYTFIVTMMPSFPPSVRNFLKGTLTTLYQKATHRYTLSVVTPMIFVFMYQVYIEKLKLTTSVAYKIYETLVGSFVEDAAMKALATSGTLVARKALPYFTKLKIRQLAPAPFGQALEIAVDAVAEVVNRGGVQIGEISPGGRTYPITPGGGGGVPSPKRVGRAPNNVYRFETPPPPSPPRQTRRQ